MPVPGERAPRCAPQRAGVVQDKQVVSSHESPDGVVIYWGWLAAGLIGPQALDRDIAVAAVHKEAGGPGDLPAQPLECAVPLSGFDADSVVSPEAMGD